MVEVEHDEPLGGGGGNLFCWRWYILAQLHFLSGPWARKDSSLSDGHCKASLVGRLKVGVHMVKVVDLPHEPSEDLISLGLGSGSELPAEAFIDCLQTGVGISVEGD